MVRYTPTVEECEQNRCKRCNCFMFPENYEIGYCGICQIKNKEDEDTQLSDEQN